MSHTTPQRVRPTASSRSFVLLRISFAQIKRILLSNTFVVLAVCYARYQIDQKDSDILRHNSVQATKQARGTFLPFSTLQLVYLLYELPNRSDRLPPSNTFMTCSIAKYQIGQTDFRALCHFNGSIICNQLELGGDHRHRLYHQGLGWRLIYKLRQFDL